MSGAPIAPEGGFNVIHNIDDKGSPVKGIFKKLATGQREPHKNTQSLRTKGNYGTAASCRKGNHGTAASPLMRGAAVPTDAVQSYCEGGKASISQWTSGVPLAYKSSPGEVMTNSA